MKIRRCRKEDLPQLVDLDHKVWPFFPATPEMILSRIKTFRPGQFLAECNGRVVGAVYTQRINYDEWAKKKFTWMEITDNGTIKNTHRPDGDTLYGVGLAVKREFQGRGVSLRLIIAAGQLAIRLNVKQILLGSRVPSYHRHSEIPINEYLENPRDPELRFYLRYGVEFIKVLPDYMPDPESLNFGVLIGRRNPFYGNPFHHLIATIFPYLIKYKIYKFR